MIEIDVIKFEECSYGDPLIWSIDDLKELREKHRIYGILCGTLPVNTQQNLFLYLPLKLSVNEAYYLVSHNYAHLNIIKDKLQIAQHIKATRKNYAFAMHNKVVQIPDTIDNLASDPLTIDTFHNKDTREWLSCIGEVVDKTKPLYETLRANNVSVLPGGRFGGKYVGYPGDPLRYHSQLIVHDPLSHPKKAIDLLEIVSNTRLGTLVKKAHVVSCYTEPKTEPELSSDNPSSSHTSKQNVKLFTIEWSGFG